MRKRKQPDLDLDPVFDKFFAAANASDDKDAIVKFLKAIKIQLESAPAKPHKPAKSFTLDDTVDYFSLTFRSVYPDSLLFHWNMDVKEMQPSACLCSVFPGLIDDPVLMSSFIWFYQLHSWLTIPQIMIDRVRQRVG